MQLLLKLRPCVNIRACIFCSHCNVTVVYSPANGVNNPQHHQRILNSESSGHDSGAHSQSRRTASLLLRKSRVRGERRGNVEMESQGRGRKPMGEETRKCRIIEGGLLLK